MKSMTTVGKGAPGNAIGFSGDTGTALAVVDLGLQVMGVVDAAVRAYTARAEIGTQADALVAYRSQRREDGRLLATTLRENAHHLNDDQKLLLIRGLVDVVMS